MIEAFVANSFRIFICYSMIHGYIILKLNPALENSKEGICAHQQEILL